MLMLFTRLNGLTFTIEYEYTVETKNCYFKQFSLASKESFKYCYVSLTIQLNISHFFTHS